MKKNLFFLFFVGGLVSCFGAKENHSHDSSSDHEHSHHHAEEKSHDDDHHHEETPENSGKGFAVIEADHHRGFRLSSTALQHLKIKTIPVSEKETLLPHSALLHEKATTTLYRVRDGWFQRLILKENDLCTHEENIQVTSMELKKGDHIVIQGAPLLRITELDLFTEDVEGHHH